MSASDDHALADDAVPKPVDPGVVDVAQQVADQYLFAGAQHADRAELIPRERFDRLAAAGLFGIGGPPDAGRTGRCDLDPSTMRRVMAAIASGCGSTFFVWAQHHGVVRALRSSQNAGLRDPLLQRLCTGETIGGTAFAHLRRSDRRAVTATPIPGGWQIDGFAPWATSWGIADIFTVAAETDDRRVVWLLIDGTEQPGLTANPLPLPVFASTGTVALAFDRLVVPDDRVVAVLDDADRWRLDDRRRAAPGQTGILGVADRAINLLSDAGRGPDDEMSGTVAEPADRLRNRLREMWARDDDLISLLADDPGAVDLEAASDHRAACLQLGQHATTAFLAAVGGGGMSLDHPAQRLAREATFFVIQAQTADGRSGTLRNSGGAPAD